MPVNKSAFEFQTTVFYITGWGHSGAHWLSKAINAHPEIYVINCYEPARLKYLKDGKDRNFRPDILAYTAFLEDIGTDYKAIGECNAYRASQMHPVKAKYGPQIPTANLVRHPYTWLDFYVRHRVNNCRMPGKWSGALQHEWKSANHPLFATLDLPSYGKDDVHVWSTYQGMWLLHNAIADCSSSTFTIKIEELLTDKSLFLRLIDHITHNQCSFPPSLLDEVYNLVNHSYRGEETHADPLRAYSAWPAWKKKPSTRLSRRRS